MIRLLFLLFTAAAATACTPSVPAGEYRIVGKIEHLPDSTVVRLSEAQGSTTRIIAADTLVDGRFSFRDTISAPKALQIELYVGNYFGGTLDVWAAPGKCVEIRGTDKQAWLWEIVSDIPEQKDEDRYRALVEPEVRALNGFQNVLHTQEEMARFMELCGRMSEKTVCYMQTAPVTRVWMNKLAEYARLSQAGIGRRTQIVALCDRMSDAQRRSSTGRRIDACLNPVSAVGVGDRMADGDLYDVDGKLHRLEEFSGKYILLEFGGKGCRACREAVPELEAIAELYRNRIEIVNISQDPELDWKNSVAARKSTFHRWNQLLGAGEKGIWASYGVLAVPHFVLIAPNGRIEAVWQGYGKGSLLEKIAENVN